MAGPRKEADSRRVTWKDVATIISIVVVMSGVITSLVAWVHAEVTIPKILNQTAEQVNKAIERHSIHPHPVSVPRGEFDLIKKDLGEDVQRIETTIQSFKTETNRKLERIESKIDSM